MQGRLLNQSLICSSSLLTQRGFFHLRFRRHLLDQVDRLNAIGFVLISLPGMGDLPVVRCKKMPPILSCVVAVHHKCRHAEIQSSSRTIQSSFRAAILSRCPQRAGSSDSRHRMECEDTVVSAGDVPFVPFGSPRERLASPWPSKRPAILAPPNLSTHLFTRQVCNV